MRVPKPSKIVEDEAVKRRILDEMRERLQVGRPRVGVHLSDLIYCPKKSWMLHQLDLKPGGRAAYIEEPPDEQVLVWVIGHSHEAIFGTGKAKGQPIEVDGIVCTPDFWVDDTGTSTLTEMKSTRMSAKKTLKEMEHYLAQVAGYCCKHGLREALVFVFHLMGDYNRDGPVSAIFRVWRVKFSKKELAAWSEELNVRRDILLSDEQPDITDERCPVYEWECRYCQVREMLGCPGSAEFQDEQRKKEAKKQKGQKL